MCFVIDRSRGGTGNVGDLSNLLAGMLSVATLVCSRARKCGSPLCIPFFFFLYRFEFIFGIFFFFIHRTHTYIHLFYVNCCCGRAKWHSFTIIISFFRLCFSFFAWLLGRPRGYGPCLPFRLTHFHQPFLLYFFLREKKRRKRGGTTEPPSSLPLKEEAKISNENVIFSLTMADSSFDDESVERNVHREKKEKSSQVEVFPV